MLSSCCGGCSTLSEGDRGCSMSIEVFNGSLQKDGDCSTSVGAMVGPIWVCRVCSTLLLLCSNLTVLSIRLYSVLVLIFWIAWWLLPTIFDAAKLTSLIFLC